MSSGAWCDFAKGPEKMCWCSRGVCLARTSPPPLLPPPPGGEAWSSPRVAQERGHTGAVPNAPAVGLAWGMEFILLPSSLDNPLSYLFIFSSRRESVCFSCCLGSELVNLAQKGDSPLPPTVMKKKKKKNTEENTSLSPWNYYSERFVRIISKDFIICKDHKRWIWGEANRRHRKSHINQGLTGVHAKLAKIKKKSMPCSAERGQRAAGR